MGEPWWRRFPGRLRLELSALRSAGFPYKVDCDAFKAGQLVLSVSVAQSGRVYALRAVFPDAYPYFEPIVFADAESFAFHQNPFEKNLCLVGRKTENWWTKYTLASLLSDRFPNLLAANTLPRDETRQLEIPQGEPLGSFYSTEPESLILVSGDWQVPRGNDGGWLKVGVTHASPTKLVGAVLAVQDSDHQDLCVLDSELASRFTQHFWGRWVRLPEFVRENVPTKLQQVVAAANPRFTHTHWGHRNELWIDIVGIVFPEEVRRLEYRDGWIFLRQTGVPPPKKAVIPRPQFSNSTLVRAERAGRSEIFSRIPELKSLREKRVLIVGLGCVGAPLAIELAKVGIQLTLVDGDEVQFGPTVRWPLGFEYLGWAKADALANFVQKQWTYAQVQGIARNVGKNMEEDEALVQSTDLIVDCSAEIGVQRYLNDIAVRAGKPMVMLSSTAGGWGGRIARFLQNRSVEPCRMCLWFYERDKEITIPPADPQGEFQPIGCGDLSFQGAGSDISEISIAGARIVFSTLAHGQPGSYPSVWWNVATISLRTSAGELITPKFETWHLAPHPECPNH